MRRVNKQMRRVLIFTDLRGRRWINGAGLEIFGIKVTGQDEVLFG